MGLSTPRARRLGITPGVSWLSSLRGRTSPERGEGEIREGGEEERTSYLVPPRALQPRPQALPPSPCPPPQVVPLEDDESGFGRARAGPVPEASGSAPAAAFDVSCFPLLLPWTYTELFLVERDREQ